MSRSQDVQHICISSWLDYNLSPGNAWCLLSEAVVRIAVMSRLPTIPSCESVHLLAVEKNQKGFLSPVGRVVGKAVGKAVAQYSNV